MGILLELFLTFFRIGLFTFGGGYAMLPFIEYNCVEKNHWITQDELMDVTIIAESTPGPIAINCASFVGFRQARYLGALFATVGVVLPSFVIILLVSSFFNHFLDIAIVANAFKGIKVAVGILILSVGVTMIQKMEKSPLSWAIVGVTFVALLGVEVFSIDFSTIAMLAIAAVVSLAVSAAKGFKNNTEEDSDDLS